MRISGLSISETEAVLSMSDVIVCKASDHFAFIANIIEPDSVELQYVAFRLISPSRNLG